MPEPRADSQGTLSDGSPLASPKRTPSPRDRPDAPRERKNGLSCAECRRSKLRCDRNVPCQACVRRGCAKLCPNGTMAATKGNKALQSHAQKLGQQVTSMAAKIKELEEALAAAQIRGSSDPPEETQAAHKGFVGIRRRSYGVGTGSLALDDEGRSRYFGDTAASEFLSGLMPQGGLHNMCYTPNFDALSLPPEIVMLYNAFPFGLRHRPYDSSLFLPYMPPRNKAFDIANIYFERFACLNNPITYDDFTETLIEPIYGQTNMPRLETLHPHRLSLFLGIMAIGCARSSTAEATRNTSAERYLVLACAALSLTPIIAEAMTATVQALYMINGYISTSTRLASEESWTLIGIMARIGDRIALHRDGAQFNLGPSELKRRRLIFWELYKTDAWTSFITGRSPAINLAHVDTKFPDSDADPQLMQYPAWKFRYAAACLWPTLKIATADVASYEDTIALDRKIRMFPVPAHLQATLQDSEAWSWSNDPSEALQQFSVICDRELNLLFLHRNYVAVALQDKDPLTHKFGGSVLAAYRGATRMCFALRDLYRLHAPSIGQLWYFWSGLFSSCIVLGAIPIMAPGCSLAQNALANFKIGCRLYSDSSMLCKDPNMMDSLNKLEHRAETNFVSYWANPANYKSTGPLPGEIDELCLLGGTEKLIKPRSPSNLSTLHTRTSAHVSHMRTQHEQIQERVPLHQPHPHTHEFNGHLQLEPPPHQQPLFSPVYPGHPIVSELDFSISDMPRDLLASFDPILNAPDPHTYAYSQPQHPMELSYPNIVGWEDQGSHPHPAGDYLMSRENIWGSFIGDLMNAPAPTAYTPYGP